MKQFKLILTFICGCMHVALGAMQASSIAINPEHFTFTDSRGIKLLSAKNKAYLEALKEAAQKAEAEKNDDGPEDEEKKASLFQAFEVQVLKHHAQVQASWKDGWTSNLLSALIASAVTMLTYKLAQDIIKKQTS